MKGFYPENWRSRYVVIFLIVMALLSLFGPRGLVHYVVLKQEQIRIEKANLQMKQEIAELKKDIRNFKKSPTQRYRVLREEMGYLEAHEYSVEFMEAVPQGPRSRNNSRASSDTSKL